MIGLRLAFLALVVLPFTLFGLPVQAAIVALRLPGWPVLPRLFFRLAAFGLGLKIVRHGAPVHGPVLLVANHISWLDILAIGAACQVSFVARADLARWPVVGLFSRLARTLYVDRTRRTDAARAQRAMADRLAEGGAVLLFAEGTSSPGSHVLAFRPALFGAARDGGVAIQPLAIGYASRNGLPVARAERTRFAWVGDMAMGDNLASILSATRTDVTLAFAAPLPPGFSRKQAASRAEAQVRAMLVAINRRTPLPPFALGRAKV